MIGRKEQIATMTELLALNKSYFAAVTGRRRIGKTYLIDQVYKDHFCFRITGIQDGEQQAQIVNFIQKLAEYSQIPIVTIPKNWQQVFILFKTYLQSLSKRKKQVIFIDELPWMATPRSGFIQMLAHLWNDYISKEKHFILVICGSATSWIQKKIIGDKGGFHNRISHHIQLLPFTLAETKEFLISKKIKLTDEHIAELYMAFGGVPYYLDLIQRGESPSAAIDRLCFAEGGLLKTEYQHLYKALFDYPGNHEAIIAALAKVKSGLTRTELSKKSKVALGGPFTRAIDDLTLSGFVHEQQPFGKIKQGTIYRLADEYSNFYHHFISSNKKATAGKWHEISKTQSYKIWLGYAFENVCIRQMTQVKRALGISNVYTTNSSFFQAGNKSSEGIQIDIVIDRADNTVNVCECKYYTEAFEMTKPYAQTLEKRKELFKKYTSTKKTVFTTLICNHPPKKNDYFYKAVDRSIVLNELF